jgi:hypothetical protein
MTKHIMKKLIFLTTVLFLSFSLSAQKAFFPSKAGTKLTYQSFDKKGKMSGQIKYTINEISGSGDHYTVVYDVEHLDDKDNRVFIDKITVKQEGDKMYFDMSNFLNKSAFQQNGEIPPSIEITGNNMEMPLIPVPGTALPDANVMMAMKMGFLNLKMTVNVTNRKVEALEDITVKAGTFNAFKLSCDVSGTIIGLKVNSKGIDWYAYGVGLIKTESYDKKGNLQSVLELVAVE